MLKRLFLLFTILPFSVVACGDDVTGPDDATAPVVVRFAGVGGAASIPPATGPARASAAQPPIVVEGTNGTLEIDEVHLIVAELELEGSEGACDVPGEPDDDEDDEDDNECPDFEAEPFFLDLPLDGTGVDVVSDQVAEGTYRKLEFEVEDVELDEDDEDEAELSALAAEIRDEFSDWPDGASLRVSGAFITPEGERTEFATYFDAEVEVEMTLDPPLEITADDASRELTVRVRPDLWFTRDDGSVPNLAALDHTEELPELEVELEEGFTDVEIDGEDDD